MHPDKKNDGFTLVELVIVMAILSILSTVTAVGYAGYVKRASNAATADFLNELKDKILMANIRGGNITKIEVVAIEDGYLAIRVFAASFADDFAENVKDVYPAATDFMPDDVLNKTPYVFILPVPASWAGSDFGAAGRATFRWTDNGWS